MVRVTGRCRPRLFLAFTAFAAICARASHAGAQPDREIPAAWQGARQLGDDAAIVSAVRLVDVADAFALFDLLTGLNPDLAAMIGRARGALALQGWSRSEIAGKGLDPDAPLLVAWGAGGAPADWRRHTLVVRATDVDRAIGYCAAVAARLDFVFAPGANLVSEAGNSPTERRGPAKPPGWWPAVKRAVDKLRPRAVAADAQGRLLLLRMADGNVIVDLIEPVKAPLPRDAHRVIARAAPVLAAALSARPNAERTVATSPARRRGKDEPQPQPPRPAGARTLLDTLGLGARTLMVQDGSAAFLVVPSALGRMLPAHDGCRAALGEAAVATAWFDEVVASFVLRPFEWRIRLAFVPTAAARNVLGGSGVDDGLLDVRGLASTGLAAGALFVPSAQALRTVPRAPGLAGPLSEVIAAVERCGPLAALVVGAGHWPVLVAAALDDLASKLKLGDELGTARNVAILVPAGTAQLGWAASFPGDAEKALATALARSSVGPPERASFEERRPSLYKLSPAAAPLRVAGLEPLPGSRLSMAVTTTDGLGWYYSQRRRPAVFGGRGRLGALHFNVGASLQRAAESAAPDVASAVRLAAQQLGLLGGELHMRDGLLRMELELGVAP